MLNTLGIAFRAGKVISGEEFVVDGIRSGKVKLVLLATDAGVNTTKKVKDKSSSYNVDLIHAYTSLELSTSIGKVNRKVIGVTDKKLATSIKNKNMR